MAIFTTDGGLVIFQSCYFPRPVGEFLNFYLWVYCSALLDVKGQGRRCWEAHDVARLSKSPRESYHLSSRCRCHVSQHHPH